MGAGLGAAAAASVAAPSFATQTANDVQQNYQARLNEARAKEFGNPYAKIAASATAGTKVETPGGAYYSNGKAENGVSYRSPNDPNACSEVRGLTQNTEASSRPDPLRPIRLCSLTLRLCVLSSCLCRRRASCRRAGVQEEAHGQVRLLDEHRFVCPRAITFVMHACLFSP